MGSFTEQADGECPDGLVHLPQTGMLTGQQQCGGATQIGGGGGVRLMLMRVRERGASGMTDLSPVNAKQPVEQGTRLGRCILHMLWMLFVPREGAGMAGSIVG